MKKFLALGFFFTALVSCTVDELPTNENANDIDKDKYQIPPNGITDTKHSQSIDKDDYQIPPNGITDAKNVQGIDKDDYQISPNG